MSTSQSPAPGPLSPTSPPYDSSPSTARRNRLIAALPPDDAAWIGPRLARVEFAVHDRFSSAGRPLDDVYFPESAVASVIAEMHDGRSVEVGTVGDEGMVGLSAFLDAASPAFEVICQLPGTALRLSAADMSVAADERPAFRRLVNRYAAAYLAQVSQTAACNRLHELERRCARWLLMTHDRAGGADRFPLTQEFLAVMLGVRRAGVSVAASHLQSAGLIRYHRGGVQVVDRAGLEAASCECYRAVRARLDWLFAAPPRGDGTA